MSDDLLALAIQVAGWAREGEQVEAYVVRGRETEVRAYEGEVESLSSATSAGIGVRVVSGSRQGFAYAGSLDPEVVSETLGDARDNCGFASADQWVGLALPDGVVPAQLDLWRDELASLPSETKVVRTLELERAVRGADRRVRQVQVAEWADAAFESAVATSTGIACASRRTVCFLAAYAVAGEGAETQTGAGFSVGRSPDDLDLDKTAADAAERATRLLGATKPRSAHLTVVLDPRVAATLLSVLGGTLDGESVEKGRSLFAERVGEQVAASALTLVDDPTDPEAYGAGPHDAEGLASRRNLLVEGGVLKAFLYDTYSGRRAGRASTGSAVRPGFKGTPGPGARALAVSPGSQSAEQVLAGVGEGLYVQSVSGVHSGVNPVSGDFSVGAEGLLIRAGELAEPVREITIASTIQRMLAGVVGIGADVERLPSNAAGLTLAIADVAMSGA